MPLLTRSTTRRKWMDGGTLDNPVGLVHFAATLRGGQLIAFAAKPALSTQKYL